MKSYRDKPLSPYARYSKAPYKYSDHYQNWRDASLAGRAAEARAAAEKHARAFGYVLGVVSHPQPDEE